MKSLLLKDFYTLKSTGRMLLVFGLMMIIITVMNKNASFAGAYIVILSAMLPLTCMGLDERAKWDKLALSMPYTRAEIVLSKYVLMLILLAAASGLNLLLQVVAGGGREPGWLLNALLTPLAGMAIVSISMPLSFRFGVEKGRVLLIAMMAVLIGVFMILLNSGRLAGMLSSLAGGMAGGQSALVLWVALGSAALFAVSAAISLRVYGRKEFS